MELVTIGFLYKWLAAIVSAGVVAWLWNKSVPAIRELADAWWAYNEESEDDVSLLRLVVAYQQVTWVGLGLCLAMAVLVWVLFVAETLATICIATGMSFAVVCAFATTGAYFLSSRLE